MSFPKLRGGNRYLTTDIKSGPFLYKAYIPEVNFKTTAFRFCRVFGRELLTQKRILINHLTPLTAIYL